MDESQLAIDIHVNKLLDWLIDRRHCQRQWQDAMALVREKIDDALKDMPESAEIVEILKGSYLDFFKCRSIVAVLRNTEASSKNLFGRYSSQRMKDWQNVISLYEKDGLFLAEGAQMLRRLVFFELPGLKRQAEKLRKAQEDCTKKERDYQSGESEWKAKYRQACAALEIQGEAVKKELLSLVRDLPSTLESFTRQAKSLEEPIEYYNKFTAFVQGRNVTALDNMQLIRFLQTKGNTTCYEYRTGKPPSQVDLPDIGLDVDDNNQEAEAGEIDWGALDEGVNLDAGDSIDFGDDVVIEVQESEIDFGDTTAMEMSLDSSADTGIATGSDALTLLENASTRQALVDELQELASFLRMRIEQTQACDSDIIAARLMQDAPMDCQLEVIQIEQMLSKVTSLEANITSDRMSQLFMIRSSPRYVERVAESLLQKLRQAEMCAANARLMIVHRNEAAEAEVAIGPQVKRMRAHLKVLQKQMEEEISKKYKNRPVNIMGEINTV